MGKSQPATVPAPHRPWVIAERPGASVGGGARHRIAGLLTVGLLVCAGLLGVGVSSASALGSGYFVTFVARSCPAYSDIFANKARNDILESLEDLGPDTQYGDSGQLVNPTAEGIPPQDVCTPLVGWEFTLGTGYESHAVTGPWGSLSIVTNPFPRAPIVTQAQTPLLNQDALPVGKQQLAGAVTIELTSQERAQASQASQLWAQGGTPTDPDLAQKFPGPAYGFGGLRCATDNLNGDNVEYVFFPAGVRHVFCYGLYVTPPPTSGTITIQKQVMGAPAGDNPQFPFNGSISYDPSGFQLGAGGSEDFYRAGGVTWTVSESAVAEYKLADLSCSAEAAGGARGASTADISGATASIHLVAGEHVTCVYTNRYVPPSGGLTIRKLTTGGVGQFDYRVTLVSGRGSVRLARATTTQPNVAVDAQPSLLNLAPGRYRISESTPASSGGDWRLVRVRCDGASRSTAQPVEVDIPSAGGVTCTFINAFVPKGSIALAKITEGGTGTASFLVFPAHGSAAQYRESATTTVPGVAAGAAPDTAADGTDNLPLGAYWIVEQPPAGGPASGWTLTTVRCAGLLVPFAQGAVEVKLTPAHPGLRCVYTDTFSATLPPPPPPINPPLVEPPPAPVFPLVPGLPAYQLSDLVVTKHASASIVTEGDVVVYQITVKNLGPDPAQHVVLADQPLGHAPFVAVQTSAGHCKARLRTVLPITCGLGTLQPGGNVTVTVRLRIESGASEFTNAAVAGTATQEQTLANNLARARVTVRQPAPPPPSGLG